LSGCAKGGIATASSSFDLIELNGDDLRRDPLAVRKATLVSLVAHAALDDECRLAAR
jgi:ATP-dependent DNA ligase